MERVAARIRLRNDMVFSEEIVKVSLAAESCGAVVAGYDIEKLSLIVEVSRARASARGLKHDFNLVYKEPGAAVVELSEPRAVFPALVVLFRADGGEWADLVARLKLGGWRVDNVYDMSRGMMKSRLVIARFQLVSGVEAPTLEDLQNRAARKLKGAIKDEAVLGHLVAFTSAQLERVPLFTLELSP